MSFTSLWKSTPCFFHENSHNMERTYGTDQHIEDLLKVAYFFVFSEMRTLRALL